MAVDGHVLVSPVGMQDLYERLGLIDVAVDGLRKSLEAEFRRVSLTLSGIVAMPQRPPEASAPRDGAKRSVDPENTDKEPTASQLNFARKLNIKFNPGVTRGELSELISEAKLRQ